MTYIRNKKFEFAIIFAYIGALLAVMCFHEPWFDEAQSWQIARCASYRDIIFTVPHYEGHPFLWHLILSIPAKLGLNYELSLKTIGFLFSAATASIIVIKAPFNKAVRGLLPFTYFCFYQYGIVVRTYCVMGLALVLLAVEFKNRKDHPFRFGFLLLLLCLTTAYGIVIAGGIALAWTIELLREKGLLGVIKGIVSDRRIQALFVLLIGALAIISLILPYGSTAGMSIKYENGLAERVGYSLFGVVADATITDLLGTYIQAAAFDYMSLFSGIAVGAIEILIIVALSKKRNLLYFFIPHVLMSVVICTLYFNTHHEGIFFFFILWYIWINLDDRDGDIVWEQLSGHLSENDSVIIRRLGYVVIGIAVVGSVSWSAVASLNDIRHQYSAGREIADFISENSLQDEYIAFEWKAITDDNTGEERIDTNILEMAVDVLPYFSKGLVTNLNPTEPDRGYLVHSYSTENNDKNFEKITDYGAPGVLVGRVYVWQLCPDVSMNDYVPVKCVINRGNNIWKYSYTEEYLYIYLRSDLLNKYNLERIEEKYSF